MVEQITSQLDLVAASLGRELGLNAAWEVEKFNAPGFFVKLLRAEQPTLAGGWTLTVQLIAAVEDRKHRTVLADIEHLISTFESDKISHSFAYDGWDFDEALELTNKLVLPAAATTAQIDLF